MKKWIWWIIAIVVIIIILLLVFGLNKKSPTYKNEASSKKSGTGNAIIDDSELDSLSQDIDNADNTGDYGLDDTLDVDLGF